MMTQLGMRGTSFTYDLPVHSILDDAPLIERRSCRSLKHECCCEERKCSPLVGPFVALNSIVPPKSARGAFVQLSLSSVTTATGGLMFKEHGVSCFRHMTESYGQFL